MKIVIDIPEELFNIAKDGMLNEIQSMFICGSVSQSREIVPDWIPWVPINNNKRPQNGQRIFISTATGKIHDVVWNSECIHNFARNGCWYKNWFVTAWMPFFIEPYKAESEEIK